MSLPKHIEEAIHNYLPHMDGWTTPERGCEMAERILETSAAVIVDIGVFAGRSTIAQGFAARELRGSMVYGIDPWKIDEQIESDSIEENARWWKEKVNLEYMHQRTMICIWAHRLDPWVTIIRNASQHAARLFTEIDFLNIDGSHTELASCRDVNVYVPKVRSGGYVMFDDCDWTTTQPALKLIEEHCDLVKTMPGANEARVYRKR
jgi:hypothetical protein